MGNTNVGTVGNWDLTDRECRVRHGQNHTDDVVGVFVDVLCSECNKICKNEGGACTGLISTWDAPFINSCGTDADNVTLSCHGGFGEPIEKLCNEALEATECDHNSICTGDTDCWFDGKNNDIFYYGTCRVDEPGISPGWIAAIVTICVCAVVFGLWLRFYYLPYVREEERTNRNERLARRYGYRQPRTDFKMARSDSV